MSVYDDKISNYGFRFVEKLLYDMKKHDPAVRELEAELAKVIEAMNDMFPLRASTIDDMPHGTGVSSPTENFAIKRADNMQVKFLRNRIDEMNRHQQAINTAMEYLTDTEKLFIKLRYDMERAPQSCWKEMHIEKSRWYELRREIIQKIAGYLGIY